MKILYTLLVLAFSSNNVFSKGGPPSVGAKCNGHYYGATGANYVYDGVPRPYGDTSTVIFEMEEGDTSFLYYSSPDPIQSVQLSCNDTTIDFTPYLFKAGTYYFSVINNFYLMPSSSIRFVIRIRSSLSVPPVPEINVPGFAVYPNPTMGDFIVRAGKDGFNGTLSVIDMNGKLVWSHGVVSLGTNDQYFIPSSGWQSGVYMLQIANATGVQRYRIVRN